MIYEIKVTQPEVDSVSITQPAAESVNVDQPQVVYGGGGTSYDDTEVKQRLTAIEGKEAGWNAKQNAISDLATIRSGAALGATALQDSDITELRTQVATLYDDYLTASEVIG